MKIEKLSENQIRCTLTRADLADRQLHLSELAYGSEKARSLFHDMMQRAAAEFGFEADNTPLMIEAVPINSDSIVLIITKVDDPEELDTRFSKFAPSPGGEGDGVPAPFLSKLNGSSFLEKEETPAKHPGEAPVTAEEKTDLSSFPARLFSFGNMETLVAASKVIGQMHRGSSTLYKDEAEGVYLLSLTRAPHSDQDFSRICNMLSEYGSQERANGAIFAFLTEHFSPMLEKDALKTLSAL
ncbi:adaptor protein MecA [Suipraeoptans intestinalis]|uniref:Adaptor protein MecA n=1 Tax=Suipraeoptans intestinalis TaxID=2606628 RepID=A0A6N7USD9_9FIRM|nr:adaptor protein MecA [Suipraeoptans intestinalis]MDD7769787.1 adaptor protein MecA [Suipraeoptans intestinalis]MDY3121040.1 adaptor protein MecA [Suipraeoptans intestinalis]MSR93841.1 adaptor protein MecA [Suipraeoptans intestinalis]